MITPKFYLLLILDENVSDKSFSLMRDKW